MHYVTSQSDIRMSRVYGCSFRESATSCSTQPSAGQTPVDNNDEAATGIGVEFKPKVEPESPTHHQHQQQPCAASKYVVYKV